MPTLLYDRPRALVLAILLAVVAGVAAFFTIPQEEDPKLRNRTAIVLTELPGASAERVERLVTQRIENALRELPEVDTIRSTSRTGLSSISITLQDSINRTEAAMSEVRDAVSEAAEGLPNDAGTPRFVDDRGYAYTVLVAVTWDAASDVNPLILKRTAEAFQSRLRDIPGTEFTDIIGAGREEIAVTVTGDIAQSLGLSETEIAAHLAAADSKGTAGQIYGPGSEIPLAVRGEFQSLDRVLDVPLRNGDFGSQVRLGDVADVRRQITSPQSEFALIGGRQAVIVGTRMETGLRVSQWAARVRQEVDAFRPEVSMGLGLEIIFDQSSYSAARFASLGRNLLIGAGLVAIILFFSLGWRSALLVTIAIPLTSLTTLGVMKAVGIPLHQMSVTGIIVALGLLVDAAIVVCDSIQRRLNQGITAREAVAQSVARLWIPLGSSTITTILAFSPIATLQGSAGEFVGAIALSVMIAVTISFFLALTVIAGLAGRFFKANATAADPEGAGSGFTLPVITPAYRGLLGASLRYPFISIGLALILPIMGFAGAGDLREAFFPAADRAQFHVQLSLSPQASVEATLGAAKRAGAILEADDRIERADWFVGASAPPFYYNLKDDQDGNRAFAEAMVTAKDLREITDLKIELQETLSKGLPNTNVLVRYLVQGPPTEAPFELRIYGEDLSTLQSLGEAARLILSEAPEVVSSTASISGGQPKIWVEADEAGARAAGLTLSSLSDALSAKLQGARGGSIIEGESELPIFVRLTDAERASIDEVASISITNPVADASPLQSTPLASLAELKLAPSASTITRYNGARVNTVLGYTRPDALPSAAVVAFRDAIEQGRFEVPFGYRFEFGGDDEARGDEIGNLLASLGLIVTAMVVVLVLSLGSFRLAGLVLVVAVLSMGLGLLWLVMFDYPFGFIPIVALIGLVGVAINAAIIILSGLRADPAAASGDVTAVKRIVLGSSRHITSTTLTTFAGFVPLMLAPGGFWPPFAVAIAGGVLLSTIVSFFLVPQSFLLLNKIKRLRPIQSAGNASSQDFAHV